MLLQARLGVSCHLFTPPKLQDSSRFIASRFPSLDKAYNLYFPYTVKFHSLPTQPYSHNVLLGRAPGKKGVHGHPLKKAKRHPLRRSLAR